MKAGNKPEDPCSVSPDKGFYRRASLADAILHFGHCYVCQMYHAVGGSNSPFVILVARFGKEEVVSGLAKAG